MQLLQCTAAVPRGRGQCNSYNAVPYDLGALGSGTPSMHSLTAWGQWAVLLLQRTASLPAGSGHCNFHNPMPHCLGAVGSGTLAMPCLTVWGHWAVQIRCKSCYAMPHRLGIVGQWKSSNALHSLRAGSGQCDSCNALPHCVGALGSATPAMHCLTA